jgi:hypothetical protein
VTKESYRQCLRALFIASFTRRCFDNLLITNEMTWPSIMTQHRLSAWLSSMAQQHGSIRSIYISAGVDSDTDHGCFGATSIRTSCTTSLSPTDMSKGGQRQQSARLINQNGRSRRGTSCDILWFKSRSASVCWQVAVLSRQHSTRAHPYTSRPLTSSHRYCLICCWSSFCSDVSVRG